jgi:hypothetical protein
LVASACGPNAPPAGAGGATLSTSGAGAAAKTAGGPYPTYIPVANAPKPDFANDDPR